MAQDWYIDDGTRVEGPVSARELRERAATGRVRPTDRVSPDRVKWVAAGKVKGLTFPPAPGRLTENDPTSPHPALQLGPNDTSLPTATVAVDLANPAPGTAETHDAPLEQVPGYEILGVLGTGACGVVYKARQVKLNRVVALKMVLMDRRASARVVARFEQEAVSLARLQHPNIVSVHDCGHHDDRAFFAMELLDGEDLDHRLARDGPLDERTAWLVARQAAAALAHAADLGVIHRDVKPANLFLVPPPTGFPLPPGVPMVKVTDFGLALTRRADESGSDPRMTAAGMVLGTPVYMPPEQFAGEVDHRADIYALGATVHHALTGRPPFRGATIWEILRKKSAPPPRLEPPVSAATADLVAAMTAVKPGDRVGSYAELLDRIDVLPCMAGGSGIFSSRLVPVLPPTPTKTPPQPEPRRRKHWVYAGLAVAVLAVAVAAAVLSGAFSRGPSPPDPPPAPKKPEYVVGPPELLYVSGSLLGWRPLGGSAWVVEDDEEKTPVLVGKGGVARPFKAGKNFRVTLGLDPYRTTATEVTVATGEGAPDAAVRWSLRIDPKAGAVFGKRVGAGGAFEPVGKVIPVPAPGERAAGGGRPYLEVRYERAGGALTMYFLAQTAGSVDAAGLRTAEVEVRAEGGPVRIDYAAAEELMER